MKDTAVFTQDQITNIINLAFAEGAVVAAKTVIINLEQDAVELFREADDKAAQAVREIAVNLRTDYLQRLMTDVEVCRSKDRKSQLLEETVILEPSVELG